jgi:hypothetical protein
MALALAFMVQLFSPALADNTTGNVTGTITSQQTGAPLAGVAVSLVSPSGTYMAKTDAKGFFSLQGVGPDTYTVTLTFAGYAKATQNGFTVNAGQTTTLNSQLTNDLKNIGRTTARTPNSAFQPTQPIDTYNVNKKQIDTILGKADNVSESNLLIALPGASLDSSGYPVLRGGRENEEGFAFEGIDYTDAFTSQFVNSLALNGIGSFSLTPGAGDASIGNAGTGSINISAKRGTRPAFGVLDLEALSYVYGHQLGLEYGFATPDGRLSAYTSFLGRRQASEYDNATADLTRIGAPIARTYQAGNDLVLNYIYKFGKDNNQQLQFVYENQINNFYNAAAPGIKLNYKSGDPFELSQLSAATGFSQAQIQSIYGLDRYQTGIVEGLNGNGGTRQPQTGYQPNETFKFQYSNNLNATTFLTAKFYNVGAVVTFDRPYAGIGAVYLADYVALQGGNRRGGTLDITKQLGDKNLITVGAKYEFLHPIFTYNSPSGGFYDLLVAGSNVGDFLPTSAACKTCGYLVGGTTANPTVNYFPNGVRVPNFNAGETVNRNDSSFYISDKFTANDRLNFTVGLRLDQTNYQYSTATNLGGYIAPNGTGYSSGSFYPTSTGTFTSGPNAGLPNPALDTYNTGGSALKNPLVVEPRAAFAFQLTKRDAITASFGRSVQFAPITDIAPQADARSYSAFAGIPANATICGPTGNRTCRDYADQLYWAAQNSVQGVPLTPLKPSTFTNYDASLSHDFGKGLSAKLTPFYRRGYDAYALVASQQVINGIPQVNPVSGAPILNPAIATNLGVTRTTGVEAYVTKESAYGFSGQLSITYLNEFSNVVPLSGSEDFFPSIPPASLALGNQYRVGFVSPLNATIAAAYRTRSGFKINPIIYANRGYPYGNGSVTAATVNGKAVNVKQTNVTSQPALGGATVATNYVDPQNPGSVFNPNIAATRGTPEGASPGSYLTAPRIFAANLDFEWSPPNSRSTFGVLVSNLFNNVYTQPSLNGRYQPVASGISGPKTGTSSSAIPNAALGLGPSYGIVNYAPERFGFDPYILSPTGAPISYRFYYQLNF